MKVSNPINPCSCNIASTMAISKPLPAVSDKITGSGEWRSLNDVSVIFSRGGVLKSPHVLDRSIPRELTHSSLVSPDNMTEYRYLTISSPNNPYFLSICPTIANYSKLSSSSQTTLPGLYTVPGKPLKSSPILQNIPVNLCQRSNYLRSPLFSTS